MFSHVHIMSLHFHIRTTVKEVVGMEPTEYDTVNLDYLICMIQSYHFIFQINVLVQERHNSIADALELRLSCTNPSIWYSWLHNCSLYSIHINIILYHILRCWVIPLLFSHLSLVGLCDTIPHPTFHQHHKLPGELLHHAIRWHQGGPQNIDG